MNATKPTDLFSLGVHRQQQDQNESTRYSPATPSGTPSTRVTQQNWEDKPAEQCLSRRFTSDVVVLIYPGELCSEASCICWRRRRRNQCVCVCVFPGQLKLIASGHTSQDRGIQLQGSPDNGNPSEGVIRTKNIFHWQTSTWKICQIWSL